MTAFVFRLTLRQLVIRRSTLLLAGLCAIPIVIAVVFRLFGPDVDPERWVARVLFLGLVVTAILPLTGLFVATSAIGDEIEDGTVIHLLTKPIARWRILAPKLLASWLVLITLVLAGTLPACFIALEDGVGTAFIGGIVIALVLGALAYTTVFVLLSVTTSRALITGLVYVFLWEGAVTAIFSGTRYLSIRHCTLAIADTIAGTGPHTFDAYVGGTTAAVMLVLAIAGALLAANRRLMGLEVREPS